MTKERVCANGPTMSRRAQLTAAPAERPTETVTLMTPIDQLDAAIGILQAIYAAQETSYCLENIFPQKPMITSAALEHAIKLLIDLQGEFDL